MKKTSLFTIIAVIIIVSAAIWHRAKNTIVTPTTLEAITIGTNAEFPPFSFRDNEAITGFDIDVITEVFKHLDKKFVLKDMPFDALIPEIQTGNIHVIAAGITPTPERAQRALFTKPHLIGNPLVIISLKTNPPLSTLADLAGKTVVVNEGYVADSFMSDQPAVDLLRLSSALVSDSILAMQSGRADAVVAATHSIKPYFEKYNIDDFYVTEIPDTEESSAFAISKHYPDLRYSIQSALDTMAEDGTLAQLKKKWKLS